MLRVLACALAALTAGCATFRPEGEVREYRGVYRHQFEVEAFQPCGSSESWWVANPDTIQALIQQPSDKTYAVIRGEVSPRGRFGHMGAYARILSVTEVIRVEPDRRC